jgi:chaperonin GroES
MSPSSGRPSLQPLGNKIILQRLAPEQRADSLIVVPDSAQEQNQKFHVVAVGPGVFVNGHRVPMQVKPGDTVLLSRYGGGTVEVGGVPVFIALEDDVLAVVS